MHIQLQDVYDSTCLRKIWSGSKAFRVVLVVTLIYSVLRLLMQIVLNLDLDYFPPDLNAYLQSARDLSARRDLYPPRPIETMEFFQYAPLSALLFTPLLWLPELLLSFVFTILHVVFYAMLYFRWDGLFKRFGMDRARTMLAWTLPAWLVFAAFWNDMYYLNIYLLVALLATLVFEAVIFERLFWSVFWISILLPTKPHWAFAAAIPLLLGRYRVFVKVVAWSAVIYVAGVVITLAAVGPEYGWDQYQDYVRQITHLDTGHPWRGPDDPYLGYNHSITQTLVFMLGDHSSTHRLSLGVRAALLIPLMLIVLRSLRRPLGCPGSEVPDLSMSLAFALYTGVFIWMSVVWELSLGIVIFPYLLATLGSKRVRIGLWILFMLYALVDVSQIGSYLVFGEAMIDDNPGPYVRTDISIYIPLIMIVTVIFHALLIWRLWQRAEYPAPSSQDAPAYGPH